MGSIDQDILTYMTCADLRTYKFHSEDRDKDNWDSLAQNFVWWTKAKALVTVILSIIYDYLSSILGGLLSQGIIILKARM